MYLLTYEPHGSCKPPNMPSATESLDETLSLRAGSAFEAAAMVLYPLSSKMNYMAQLSAGHTVDEPGSKLRIRGLCRRHIGSLLQGC